MFNKFNLFKKKGELLNDNKVGIASPRGGTSSDINNENNNDINIQNNNSNNSNSNGSIISTSGERKFKTKLSKTDILTKSDSTNSSPRSVKSELCIKDIPYDLFAKILELIHGNRILTKEFMVTNLVCKKWRALARLNGNHIDLEAFFKKAEASKMKFETIEGCMNYLTYMYQSLEVIDLGRLCINNRNYAKYSILLLESMDKITKLSLDMSKVTLSEFEVVTSSLKSLKSIKELTVHNMTQLYAQSMISLLESLPELEILCFTELTFENSNEDHDIFVQYLKKNNTIQKLSITLLPDNTRFLNSLKVILGSNRALKHVLLSQSLKRPSLTSSSSSNNIPIIAATSPSSMSNGNGFNHSGSNSTLHTSYSVSKFSYNHDSLSDLNLCNMGMSDNDVSELAENIIQNNSSIKSLDISYNRKVSSSALETFLRILGGNLSMPLETLNISGLSINDQCIQLVGEIIGNHTQLKELYINDCIDQYWSDGFKYFSSKLINHPTLTTLQLNRNRIETKCFDDLAQTISHNKSRVRYLGLSGTLNNAQSLHLICSSLGTNSNLVSLDISNCEVSYCPSLTESLVKNFHLAKLNVNNCKLNPTTLLRMANSHLSIIDIGSNNFSGDAIQDFFDSLKSNNSLYVLNISNTGLRSKECQSLSNLLDVNSKIHSIDLSNNKIKGSDIQCIIKCIQSKNLPPTTKFTIKLKETKIDLSKISNELSNNQILVDY